MKQIEKEIMKKFLGIYASNTYCKSDCIKFLNELNKILELEITYDTAIPINLQQDLTNIFHNQFNAFDWAYEYHKNGREGLINIHQAITEKIHAVFNYAYLI